MKLPCPRDGAILVQQEPDERKKHCPACKGVFLNKDQKVFDLLRALIKDGGSRLDAASKIGCPACSQQMYALIFRGVEVDLCMNCKSAWLDKGEISKIESTLGRPSNSDYVFGPVTDSILDQLIQAVIGQILN